MSAAGEPISVIGKVIVSIQVGNIKAYHPLVVVHTLITPVILGMDFLQKHGLVWTLPHLLRFKINFLNISYHPEVQPILEEFRKVKARA